MHAHETLDGALQAAARDGVVSCRKAFEIAGSYGESPRTVGQRTDALGLRIASCQLGLFGYADFGEKTWIRKPASMPAAIEAAIRGAGDDDAAVACAALWRIADDLGIPRAVIGSCADALSVRVRHCQLGCF